jgi:hypothetical protein
MPNYRREVKQRFKTFKTWAGRRPENYFVLESSWPPHLQGAAIYTANALSAFRGGFRLTW